MDSKIIPHENQLGGWHRDTSSSLLRGDFGEILKPVKPNANPTYSKELSTAILIKAGHNHSNKLPNDCHTEENESNHPKTEPFRRKRLRSTKDFFSQLSLEEQLIPEASEIVNTNVLLDTSNNNIKSPCDEGILPATLDELEFYTAINTCTHSVCSSFKNLIPPYFGCINKTLDGKDVPHMVLGDLTTGMVLPCIADIKMGRTSLYPGRKNIAQVRKYLVQESLGFCLAGMNIVNCQTGERITRFLPDTGKKLTVEQVFNALGQLVQRDISSYYSELLTEAILSNLQDIQNWLNSQRTYLLRSSSILITYDAQPLLPQDVGSITASELNVTDSNTSINPTDGDLKTSGESKYADSKTSNGLHGADSNASLKPNEADLKTSNEPHDANSNTSRKGRVNVMVKLIDFAHVFLAGGEADDNYLYGLNNLITFYTEELQRIKQN